MNNSIHYFLAAIFLIALLYFLYRLAFANKPNTDSKEMTGQLSDLDKMMTELMSLQHSWEFMVVQFTRETDFIQFSTDSKKTEVQLDFPLVTERQQSLETKAREILKDLNCSPYVTDAGGGDLFLDCDLNGNPQVIAKLSIEFATRLYGLDKSTQVTFSLF